MVSGEWIGVRWFPERESHAMRRVVLTAFLMLAIVASGCQLFRRLKPTPAPIDFMAQIQIQAEAVLDFVEGKTETTPGFSPVSAETAEEPGEVDAIVVQLRDHCDAIMTLKKAGCLAENNRGRVELSEPAFFAEAEEKNAAQKTLSEENKIRKDLYREIARLYREYLVSISDVQRVFVLRRIMRAEPGAIVQLPKDGEDLEMLKSSPAGKRLGETCVADAWVTIP